LATIKVQVHYVRPWTDRRGWIFRVNRCDNRERNSDSSSKNHQRVRISNQRCQGKDGKRV